MESISSLAFKSAKVVCEFDELTTDNLQNQILKATIRRLSRTAQVEKQTRSELAHLAHAFDGVSDISLSAADFTRLQIYSQSGVYRLLIRLCKLAYESLLPLQNGNGWTFSDFTRDDVKMAKLFEDFVFSFFSAEQSEFKVKRDTLNWDVYAASELSLQYLPGMRTDVSLRSATRTIVLDAKYYQQTLATFYGKESIHSANLYQMFAYLKNFEQFPGQDAMAAGILLYPTVQQELDHAYNIQGHQLRVCTVNLAAPRTHIHRRLLSLLTEGPSVAAIAV